MSRKYKFHKPEAAYFVSFATVNWTKIFVEDIYFQILCDNLNFCRKEKGMEIYAYCLMPNHVHLVFRSLGENPAGLIGDFKGYTSKRLVELIKESNHQEKDLWLRTFLQAGLKTSNVKKHQLWQHDNQPFELYSPRLTKQKVDYIHRNPVAAGLVSQPENWKYSSARNYAGLDAAIEIDM